MSNDSQRRHFTRIPFDARYRLSCAGAPPTEGSVMDLSLKGALILIAPQFPVQQDAACELELILSEGDVVIQMQGHVAHVHPDCLGIACDHIDLDSMSHLRRFLELNLGSQAQLEREINEMLQVSKH